MELTFEKWEDGRWFVVFPDYDGDQKDLEMVDGADTLLDYLTTDGMYVNLEVSSEEQKDWNSLHLFVHDEIGGTYTVSGIDDFKEDVWLCNVMHNVFGEHPEIIYFKVL